MQRQEVGWVDVSEINQRWDMQSKVLEIKNFQVEGYRGILGWVFRSSESEIGRNSKLQGLKDSLVHRVAAAPLVSWGCVPGQYFLCSLHVAITASATCRPAPGVQCCWVPHRITASSWLEQPPAPQRLGSPFQPTGQGRSCAQRVPSQLSSQPPCIWWSKSTFLL